MSVKTVENWSAQFLRVDVEMLCGQSPHLSFQDGKERRQRGACWKWEKVVQLAGKGGITVVDSRSAVLVLRDLLQASPDSSGVVGSELVLNFTLVLKLGLLDHSARYASLNSV